MADSAAIVAGLAEGGEPVYGVSTGFGSLATVAIPAERRAQLQRSLLRSHAAGMGEAVEVEVVRAMMLLRARTLAMGYSGARPEVAETILALLNARLTPVVPEHGSLGASGDLAPLAHCGLALIGEGEVIDAAGERLAASEALAEAGIEPLELIAKEGLALINGTDGILGMLVLAIADLRDLMRVAEVAAAMSVEALLGTDRAFAADLIGLRPQPGQAASAANLRRLLSGSAIVASHRHDDPRVQDAYSLRCAPQVAGAARDALRHAEVVAAAELEAAIDNPMVLPDGRIESCGNFHGAPLGFACDLLAIAVAEVGAIAERRTDRLLDAEPVAGPAAVPRRRPRSRLRPDDRPLHAGGDGGSQPAPGGAGERRLASHQRDAGGPRLDGAGAPPASCASRSATWAGSSPSSSTPPARALDLRAPLEPARGTAAALAAVRTVAPGPGPDRILSPELAEVERLVTDRIVLDAVEAEIGALL